MNGKDERPLAAWWLVEEERFRSRFASREHEGWILPLVRACFALKALHWGFDAVVWLALRKRWQEPMTHPAARGLFRSAGDTYNALMLVGLVGLYALCYAAVSASFAGTDAVLVVAVVLTLFRTLEIGSVVIALHFAGESYSTSSAMRAVILTVMNYCELGIAFAVFYVSSSYWNHDSFRGMMGSCVGPLYFSFVTLVTLGYGDFHPEQPPGQCLVLLEVVLGVVLLAVILQRVVAVSLSHQQSPGRGTETHSESK